MIEAAREPLSKIFGDVPLPALSVYLSITRLSLSLFVRPRAAVNASAGLASRFIRSIFVGLSADSPVGALSSPPPFLAGLFHDDFAA